jgi:hypothetical protein
MNIATKLFGPKSKYDKSLPYTYMAKIDVLNGQGEEPVYDYYFADTICGLIEYLDEHNIHSDEVIVAGLYQTREYELNKTVFTDGNREWLKRPKLCQSIEAHFKKTLDEFYKGHVDDGECSFEDRDRQGAGPF